MNLKKELNFGKITECSVSACVSRVYHKGLCRYHFDEVKRKKCGNANTTISQCVPR